MRAADAVLLVRCQELRAARALAEAQQRAADAAMARNEAEAARSRCEAHAAEAVCLMRDRYDGMVGQVAAVAAMEEVRRQEVRNAHRQATLRQEHAAAMERLDHAAGEEAAAQRHAAACARQQARREKVLEVAVDGENRAAIRCAGVRVEDEHAMRAPWRT